MKNLYKFSSKGLSFWFIMIFGIVIMLDPANNYRLKIPMFGLALLGELFTVKKQVNRLCYVFVTIFALFTIFGITNCLVGDGNIAYDFQFAIIQLVLMSLLIIPMSHFSLDDILKMNYIIGLILAFVINILFLFSSISSEFMYGLYMMNMKDQAIPTILMGSRVFLGIKIVAFFYKTAPFLFFASIYKFCHAHSWRDYIIAIFLIYPIFITGSRTPILCGFCILFYWFLTTRKISLRLKVFITSLVLILGIILIYYLAIDKSDNSAEIKGGNFLTYVNDIFSFRGSLTGWGVGSELIDVRGLPASHTELSYFDILRMWGLLLGSCFILFLLYPLTAFTNTKNKDIKSYLFAYFLYMVLAGTNPFIFASTGWFIILTAYCVLIKSKKVHSCHPQPTSKSHDLSVYGHI